VSTKELYNWKFSSDNCWTVDLSIPLPSLMVDPCSCFFSFYGFIYFICSFCVLVFSVLFYCGATFVLCHVEWLNFGGAA
jgi:hypothetical protein